MAKITVLSAETRIPERSAIASVEARTKSLRHVNPNLSLKQKFFIGEPSKIGSSSLHLAEKNLEFVVVTSFVGSALRVDSELAWESCGCFVHLFVRGGPSAC